MEATELMIGDWVGRVFDDKRIDYRQVDWIRTGEIGMRYQKVWAIGCIEPIPLTPEILKKNGIKKRRDEYVVFGWEGMKQWYITLEDFKPQYDFWFITSSDRDLNIIGQIRYVHQLQHALRICGLDELADNFKI